MPANIRISLLKPRLPLFGVGGTAVLIDGEVRATLNLGETATVEVPPGERKVEVELKGVIKRRSRVLNVVVSEGGTTEVKAKYSRLSGSVQLSSG